MYLEARSACHFDNPLEGVLAVCPVVYVVDASSYKIVDIFHLAAWRSPRTAHVQHRGVLVQQEGIAHVLCVCPETGKGFRGVDGGGRWYGMHKPGMVGVQSM